METVLFENDQLFTPKQIADAGILSLASQYELRRSNQLSFFKVDGSKIMYAQKHLDQYFAKRQRPNDNEKTNQMR